MADFEGSVAIEGIDVEDSEMEETPSEDINNQETTTEQTEDNQEEESRDENQDNSQDDSQDSDGEQPQKTDKGTNLDPNPKSAVHQQLANAKREVEDYRRFMSDPEQVERYLEELRRETGKAKVEPEKAKEEETFVTDPDKIETVDDLKSYAKYLRKTQTEAIEDMKSKLSQKEASDKVKETGTRIASEIDEVQKKYPELRPTNPDGTPNPEFDPELEKEVADLYQELDFDKKTGLYRGNISVRSIADRVMKVRRLGESTGSKRAQTVVIDKRNGAVKTNNGGGKPADESQMSPAQTIASRIQRAMKNR